jgi:hypothetical protein
LDAGEIIEIHGMDSDAMPTCRGTLVIRREYMDGRGDAFVCNAIKIDLVSQCPAVADICRSY